jgi:CBS domain containing-hemolysin-like protein
VTEGVLLLVCVVLVAGNALFVAAEFSLVTVDRATVAQRAEAGDAPAARVRSALRSLSTQLSGAQLGITVTSLVVGFLAEPAIASLLTGPLVAAGVPEAAVRGVSVTIALLIATGFQMVLGELVPKNLAIARPLPVARAVAGPQLAFTTVAGPLIRFLNGNANGVLRRFGIEPQEELASARSPEELGSLVRRSAEAGTLERSTARLLDRSLHFGDRTAADVLTPRRRVRFIDEDASVADLLELVRDTGHSRFPVLGEGGADDVSQIAHVRMALRVAPEQRPTTPVREIAVPAVLVPETVPIDALLTQLRAGHGQLALVVDEYGGTAGVVSLEDLVEELVGDVHDEHDVPVLRVRCLDGGTLVMSGLLRPDEVSELGIPCPQSDSYDTVGGFLTHDLGRIAAIGDHADVPGWRLEVTRMDGRRIDEIRAVPSPGPGARHEDADR